MLASWRGARLEVIQVLREVLDHVLKEPGVSDSVMYNRARVGRVSFILVTCADTLFLGTTSHRSRFQVDCSG